MGCAQSRAAAGAVVVETGVPSACSPSGAGHISADSEPRPVPVKKKAVGNDESASWPAGRYDAAEEAAPGRLPSSVSADSGRDEEGAPCSEAEAVFAKEDRTAGNGFSARAENPVHDSSECAENNSPKRDSKDQPADRAKNLPPKTPTTTTTPATTRKAKAPLSLPPKPPMAPKKKARKTKVKGNADPSCRKLFRRSSSVLEDVIEGRDAEGDFTAKVVHIELPGGKPIEDVYDGVHDGEELGAGVSGVVRRVSHRSTGVQYAVKCLDLEKIKTEEGLQQLREEIYIMCQLDHPNIVRLEEVYEDESAEKIYLVQELCTGKELFDRLDEQADYGEARCAELVSQMLSAVRFLHSKGIVHRDLKCENFLFTDESPGAELRMIDFGLSKHFTSGEAEHDVVGTPYTVAPEVIRGCYDERCDLWAVGVIAFFLLCGDTPFGGCDDTTNKEIRDNILSCNYSFEPAEIWDDVSDEAKDFIRSLLVLDPTRRLTAEEAQKSPWLQEWGRRSSCGELSDGEDTELNANVVEALLEFREYTDMQKLLCEVLSFTLLPDQIERMRREFRKLDSDGLGEISLRDFKVAVSRLDVVPPPKAAGRRSSLRPLTDEEIEGVFDAMRQHRAEARIHWHEFVAAGLRLCDVDERNIRLAFDRLDADHKGYISFDNILDLSGSGNGGGGEEASEGVSNADKMRRQWCELMRTCRCSSADRITYEDFRCLMDRPKDRIRCGPTDHHSPQAVLLAAVSSAIQA